MVPEECREKLSWLVSLAILITVLLLLVSPRILRAEEPKFEVDFSFGSIGINAEVYDSSTGERIPKGDVNFTALPTNSGSIDDVNRIKVDAPGYKPSYVSSFTKFSINMGFIQLVTIQIGRVELDPKRPTSLTIFSSPSGATVYIDGSYRGKTPKRNLELGSGSYEIRLSKNGYHSWSKRVYLDTGEQKTISSSEARLEKKNERPTARFDFSPNNPSSGDEVQFKSRSRDSDGRITDHTWTFGDGSKGWGERTGHVFNGAGTYRVRLKVTDNHGATDSTTKTLRVKEANQPPRVSFTVSPQSPTAGDTVRFDASRTDDPDGGIDGYKWRFGDGSVDYGKIPEHKYSQSGTYTVKLSVTDNDGGKSTSSRELNVGERVSSITVEATDRSGARLNAKIYVDGKFKANTGGDGEYRLTGLSPGSHEVQLKKENYLTETKSLYLSGGEDKKISLVLKKRNKPPVPSFTVSPEEPRAKQQILFNASSSRDPEGEIKEYIWDFDGDENRDKSGVKVNYSYDSKGKHTAKLTLVDKAGKSSSVTKEIAVRAKREVEIDEKYGLVVGVTEYKFPGLNNLKFPAEDAKDFYNLLVDDKFGGIQKNNLTLLTNEDATTERFDKAMSNLVTQAGKDDLVVIYYSGHGARGPDPDGDEDDELDEYYMTYNSDPSTMDELYKTAYRDDRFANKVRSLSNSQVQVAIFLDSCYSGGAARSVKGYTLPGQKAVPNNNVFSDFSNLNGTVLFAASQENQVSWESDELEQGVFSHYLFEGLKGKADLNSNGMITIDELNDYLGREVKKFTEEHFDHTQVPRIKGGISAPLLERKGGIKGEVEQVIAEKENAGQGDYIMITLGRKDGVKEGDRFKVFLSTEEIDVVKKVYGIATVSNVVGPHLSLARVIESDFNIRAGFKIAKLEQN